MEERIDGRADRWKSGSMEERIDGRIDRWKSGSMEELQIDSMEGRTTERRVTRDEVTSSKHRGINTAVSMKDLRNLVVYYTYIPDPNE